MRDRQIFYALKQILNLAGISYLFAVYYTLLTNKNARNLDCLLHLPLVFYCTCFQLCILPYENPNRWLQGEDNTCDDRSFVMDFIYYFFSFGMIPGISVSIHVPFLVFWKARVLKNIQRVDVLYSFLKSVTIHAILVFTLIFISTLYKPDYHQYDLGTCGIDALIMSIFSSSYLAFFFAFFLFIWFNGLKIFLGSLSGKELGLLSVAGISWKSKPNPLPNFLNETARSMFFTFSTASEPSESTDSDLRSAEMTRNSNFELSSSCHWVDEMSSSESEPADGIESSSKENSNLDPDKTIRWNLNSPTDNGNIFLGVSVIEPGAYGTSQIPSRFPPPDNLNSDIRKPYAHEIQRVSSEISSLRKRPHHTGYKGLMTKPKTPPARVAPYRPSKKLLTPPINEGGLNDPAVTPWETVAQIEASPKTVRFEPDCIPLPLSNKPSSLDESGNSLPVPGILPALELQDTLSLSFSTSVMNLAHVARSMRTNQQCLSDSEVALMQQDSNHVYSAESIRVVNTFDGLFLKACSFIFVTLFVLLVAYILESLNISAPFLYNIGLLLRQASIVLSAHLFFQSTSLQEQPEIDTELPDISDTGVAGNKETALQSTVSMMVHKGSVRDASFVEPSRLTSIRSNCPLQVGEGGDSSFSSGVETGWVDQSFFFG